MNGRRTPVVETLEGRCLLAGTLSEQIIVDQFGWRADAPRKVVLFADPINGQNSAVTYVPGATFQVRRVGDDGIAFTGSTVQWRSGQTNTTSGDRVWSGDFSSLTTPGEYYVYEPANDRRSFAFNLNNDLYNDVLKTSIRTLYYQRTGTAIPASFGGNWTHAIDHVGFNQDTQARLWQTSSGGPVAGSTVRDVSGGWFDAGDYNKYVPYTTGVMWNLLQAFEWNPTAFGDNWNIPESGNGAPDVLDEIKWEIEWLRKMQLPDGSVMNRVANPTFNAGNFDPSTDNQARYYTAATTWATASFAASLAHASRVFAPFDAVYPGYAQALRTAAESAWAFLQATPNTTPASGNDGGGTSGGSGQLAATAAGSDANGDRRLRVLAAAELWKTTGTAAYKTYFEANYKNSNISDNGFHPLLDGTPRFDASTALDLNHALVTYATTPGASTTIVNEVKAALLNNLDESWLQLGEYNNGTDPYRAFMWDGHYTWGSNQLKSEWANVLTFAIKLNVGSTAQRNLAREVAEEYLHYIHGRNPLSQLYLSNMGTKGANLGGDKSAMEVYHSWFGHGSSLYDGASSTYGPIPGYLVGGPNQFFSIPSMSPPGGQPPAKSFRDWNTGWPENSWEITEPAIYYQAAYSLLLSQYATAAGEPPPAPQVTGVFVAGNTWTANFFNHLQSASLGDATAGYAIDPANQLDELPWTNLNKLSVRFSRNVNVAQGNLAVSGVNVGGYGVGTFTYDAGTFTATWTLDTAGVGPDKLLLNLSGVTDAATGAALDGEWPGTGPSAFPSGNGTAGGTFRFRLNVLPGDANRSGGAVIGSDVTLVRNAQNATPGAAGSLYTIFKDVNGSATIVGSDVTLVRNRQGLSLPAGEPPILLMSMSIPTPRTVKPASIGPLRATELESLTAGDLR
jgi:hypothetical protein